MSGQGYFNMYFPGSVQQPNVNNIVSLTSRWMQYDPNETLYITVGNEDLGDPLCINHFWFVPNKHYVLNFGESDCTPTTCECISGYGYQEEVEHYNSTYLGYVGRSYSYKYGREVDVYSGTALDGVGPLTLMMYIGTNDSAYVALNTINTKVTGLSASSQYYNEYFYNNVNMTVPDAKYFVIPDLCLETEKNEGCSPYPFYPNGTRIVTTTTTTTSTTTSTTTTGSTTGKDCSGASGLMSSRVLQLFVVVATVFFVMF